MPFRKARKVLTFPLKDAPALLRKARNGEVLEDWKQFIQAIGKYPLHELEAMDTLVAMIEEAEKAGRKKS